MPNRHRSSRSIDSRHSSASAMPVRRHAAAPPSPSSVNPGGAFDGESLVPYTRTMRRSLAFLLAASLFALQGEALAFHVHAGPGRAGTEHRHGPAIHHHQHDRSREVALRAGADVPGRVIRITVPAAVPFQAPIPAAILADELSPRLMLRHTRRPTLEVRSHGPPADRLPCFRAPPPSRFP